MAKKVKTPQGFGREQEQKKLQQELLEDLKLQKEGWTIQRIGGFKVVTDPKGNTSIEAKAKKKSNKA